MLYTKSLEHVKNSVNFWKPLVGNQKPRLCYISSKVQRLSGKPKKGISSMKKLNSQEIKKALFGIILTDGSAIGKRFSIYSKEEEFIDHINYILNNITGISNIKKLEVNDARFTPPAKGWKLWTTNHVYFEKLNKIFYFENRKHVTKYIADRFDKIAFAYAWMCDGYLEHRKNRSENKIQNLGWLCSECFTKDEQQLIVNRLFYYNIASRIVSVSFRGIKYNRIKISGLDLQKFIDMIYPHVLDCYKYKTEMYYKSTDSKYVLTGLSNTEHIIRTYNNVDDIVRHS
jgi:hypothetical protein